MKPQDVPRPVLAGAVLAVLAALVTAVWWGIEAGPLRGLGAGLAILLGAGVLYLAASVPGKTPEGLFLGLGITLSSMVAWTYPKQVVWGLLAVILLVCVAATYPWWKDWSAPLKLGTFWLGAPIWAYGALAALLSGGMSVSAQRVVYGGYALAVTLLVVQAVRRRGRDISIGLTAGMLAGLGLLLIAGCRDVFPTVDRFTPANDYGFGQGARFWGGVLLTFHPNAYAMAALLVVGRLGPDRTIPRWLRIALLPTSAFFLYLAQSRTAYLLAVGASVIYALLYIWRHGLPRWRFWRWLGSHEWRLAVGRALVPLLVTALMVSISGGVDMLVKSRYDPTQETAPVTTEEGLPLAPRWLNSALSGRPDLWWLIFDDFRTDSTVEKALGNTDDTRGTILRYRDPSHERYQTQTKLGADNSLVAALRRGGVVGLLTALIAFLVILWRTTRRGVPVWVPVVVLVALAQSLTEDELVFTTLPWLMVASLEAWLLWGTGGGSDPPSAADESAQRIAA
ncbi:MAG: hypothetical protein ACRDTM_11550 [Micromonosporaceae bacterium]